MCHNISLIITGGQSKNQAPMLAKCGNPSIWKRESAKSDVERERERKRERGKRKNKREREKKEEKER